MLFTPIQASCALSEDPAVLGVLGTFHGPCTLSRHLSLPPHPDPCLLLSCPLVPMAMHPPPQCCQGPVCEDRGGSDPEAVSGAPHFLGSYLGPGGCGRHRKVCGYVPGPFETRSAASGTQRLLFGMPRESIAANSPHSSVSHRFLKLPVSETVQCSDKNRKADGTNEVSLITMTGGNTD